MSQPLLYLSGFFEEYRDEYHRGLLAVGQRGEWAELLHCFLTGVGNQAQSALADTRRILDLYEEKRKIMRETKRMSKEAPGILDHFFLASPMLTISGSAKMAGAGFPTVSKGVEYWQQHGLLKESTGDRRNRLFVAEELLQIMRVKKTVFSCFSIPSRPGIIIRLRPSHCRQPCRVCSLTRVSASRIVLTT